MASVPQATDMIPSRVEDKKHVETAVASRVRDEQPGHLMETTEDNPGDIALPAVDNKRFFTMAELDLPPYLRGELPPDPPILHDRPEAGRLVMEIWIDENGRVLHTEVIASDLPEVFAEATAAMLEDVRYVPAKKNGEDVRARIRIELNYAPSASPLGTVRPLGKGFR